ncbi:hypothetical protein [Chromatocurvus halotolerans]|uniref:Uncharacterized protein n=1 Tax=Chromatocurvus halotolerans TaxID=1132028 RepID=A0A4R2KZH4_9GAMM|nr:hypothetical protein [Chromatocurvus halotolerans]TCO78612.1 hypothetical protein EV688_101430 [Chromatocurvus halotolerans]
MNSYQLGLIVLMMLNAAGGILLALDESVAALAVFGIAMVGLVIVAVRLGMTQSQARDDN